MAAPQQRVDLLDHLGPWTEEDFLALPEDRRIELLDGQLLVSPQPTTRHQRISSRTWAAIDRVLPAELEALEAINVRTGAGRILIPDLAVVTADLEQSVVDAADVLLVGEVVSPSGVAWDRAVKPPLYAAAGIRYHLLVDPAGPSAVLSRLRGDRYEEVTRAGAGGVLRVREPFVLDLDLAALIGRRGGGGAPQL